MRGVSLTQTVLASFSFFKSGEFLLHIPCCCHFYLRSFCYTSDAGFIFIGVVCVTYPILASFLSGEFLLHIPCWLHFYLGSFSYTSQVGFTFLWGVSLTHPMLFFFAFSSSSSFVSIWGVSLLHPVLASFLFSEFVLIIPCSLHFYVGSFSYTSHDAFIFI